MEITISEKEFDEAVDEVLNETISDENLKGVAILVVPILGMKFAHDVKDILFKNEQENDLN